MASPILSVEELFEGRQGTPYQMNGARTYTRRFLVYTAVKEVASIVVCSAPGIPIPYSPYTTNDGSEFDLQALLVTKNATQDGDDSSRWIVDCVYSTEMPAGGPPANFGNPNTKPGAGNKGSSNNPELEKPDIEWDFEQVQVAQPHDLFGKPFLNAAKQPFSPPPMIDMCYAVLVITRNELGFNYNKAMQYAFAVNSDQFLGSPPGFAQCTPPKAKMMHRGEYQYWRVTYRIRFKQNPKFLPKGMEPERWQPKILNQGMMELVPNPKDPNNRKADQLKPIIGFGNVPVTQPVLLDFRGKKKEPNALGVMEPDYIEFQSYPSVKFNKLLAEGLA